MLKINANILPAGYTQLEYIENSTAGAYFITNVQPITDKTAVEVMGYITNGNSAFGGAGNSLPAFNCTSITATIIQFRYGLTLSAKVINDTNGKFSTIPATIKFGNNEMYLDGELKKTMSEPSFTYDYPMRIWARTASSLDAAIGRIYFANIYEDNVLMFKGIPAKRNSDNTVGLFDLVSNSFLESSGAASFTAGPEVPIIKDIHELYKNNNSGYDYIGDVYKKKLPTGYTQLEYIKSTTQNNWFKTGLCPNYATTRLIFDGYVNTSSSIYGATSGRYGATGSAGNMRFDFAGQQLTSGVPFNQRHAWEQVANKFYVDGVLKVTCNTSATVDSREIYLFARNEASGAPSDIGACTCYGFKCWLDGVTLSMDLVPAKNSSNVLGFYDLVSDTFITNQGSGTLTAGPEVPDYECIFSAGWDTEVTGTNYLSLPNARAKSTSWEIAGNTSQNGTPTSTTPIDVKGVGDEAQDNYQIPILKTDNCGCVDLGTLNWFVAQHSSTYAYGYCYAPVSDMKTHVSGGTTGIYINGYESVQGAYRDKIIYTNNNSNYLMLVDSRFNNVSELLAELSGKHLYYQRTTDATWTAPTITNISLTSPLNKIDTYQDSIDSNGTLTRNTGIKVFNGTENWTGGSPYFTLPITGMKNMLYGNGYCSHFTIRKSGEPKDIQLGANSNSSYWFEATSKPEGVTDIASWKAWLAEQYAAGTPVILYYPLATATTSTISVPSISTTTGNNYVEIETELSPSETDITYRKKTKE